MTAEQRCLDETEKMYWQGRGEKGRYTNCDFAIEYKGELDINAIERALCLLAERYPALRATVRKNDQCNTGYSFCLPEDNYPEFTVLDGNMETMIDYSKRRREGLIHLNNETPTLAHLVVIRGQNRGYIMVGIHHILFTAAQLHVYIPELFQIYTEIVTGHDIQIEYQPFPEAPEKFRENTYTQKEETNGPNKVPRRRMGYERLIKLNKEETAFLIGIARENNVKIHSIIASCMTIALRKHYDCGAINPIEFGVSIDWTSRNGRKGSAATSAVSNHRVRLNVSNEPNPIQLAQELHEKKAAIKPPSDSPVKEFLGEIDGSDIALNNGGKFTIPSPKNLELTDFIISPYIKEWRTPEAHELIVDGSRSGRPRCGIAFYTFNDELTLWCLLREDVNVAIIDDFTAQLRGEFYKEGLANQ